MAPGVSTVPPPGKRTGSWLYVDVDANPGRMHCRGDGCRWANTPNKTRARDHLVGCAAAKRSFPEMMGVLLPAANSPGAPPPATAKQLHEWRLLWTEAMCESCLPLGFFETPTWRAALTAVTGGRFTGPGDRRMLASTYVPLVAAKSDKRTAERIREADSSAVSMDGATVNRQGVYNFVNYSPLALLYATTRLGAVSPTGDNLLTAIKDSFKEPIMAVARLGASAGGGVAAAPTPRWRRFLDDRAPVVVSDSPSAMVRMRSAGVGDGTFAFGYGCAAHAGNLVAQDAAKFQPFALALRSSLSATVFFLRCGRPRTLHAATVSNLVEPGRRRIRGLQAYSRTRWVGEAGTIAAVEENIPALRHTLFSNTLSENPFDVPTSVTEALKQPSRAAIGQSTPFLTTLAAVVAVLEADAAPLSSYAGLFACLRSSLDTHFSELPPGTRAGLQRCLSARYAAFSDPLVALAFYLDGFWGPARGRVAGLLWAVREGAGGQTLPELRDAAIASLADGDAALGARLQAELSEFLAFAAQPAREDSWRRLHPRSWWRLYGDRFELWNPICWRLFSFPASAAGGERAFKRLHQVHTARRNRLSPHLVDQLTRIAFNNAQLRRPDPVTVFSRSSTELKLRRFFVPADSAGEGGGLGGHVGGVGGEGGAGALGVDTVGGAGADAGAPAAAADGTDGNGLDVWGEEEEAPPDIDPADVDAIVAQLLL